MTNERHSFIEDLLVPCAHPLYIISFPAAETINSCIGMSGKGFSNTLLRVHCGSFVAVRNARKSLWGSDDDGVGERMREDQMCHATGVAYGQSYTRSSLRRYGW